VIIRDTIPITIQEWNEPKKARVGASFVEKRSKRDLWKQLMENFILPPEYSKFDDDGNEILGGRERRRTVKEFALKKMAEAFWNYKKMLYVNFVMKKKTPVFEGAYEKLREQWPEFVAFKDSERAKEMSLKNKENAQKKTDHHGLGPGGYNTAVPKWEAMEGELRTKEITLGIKGWPERAKHWWYRHGGSLDPATGECVHRKKIFNLTAKPFKEMVDAQAGSIRVY
jgi:hypothetical protein